MEINLHKVRSGIIGEYDKKDSPLFFSWQITGKCPYKCSYCYELDAPKRAYEPGLQTLLAVIPRLKQLFNGRIDEKNLMIRLFGGEPLAHKSFLPFLSALRDNFPAAELGCLSNAYRPLSFFRKLLAIDPGFRFSFSVHFEAVKEKDLLEKIAFIGSQKAPMHLQLQFLPAARARVRKLAEILRSDFPDVKYSIHFLRTPESDWRICYSEYTPEDYEWARAMTQSREEPEYFIDYLDDGGKLYRRTFTFDQAFEAEKSDFKGSKCILPLRKLELDEKGNLAHAHCMAGFRKNIFDENWNPASFNLTKPVVCVSDFCHCRGMRGFAKYYDPKFAPVYLGGERDLAHDKVRPMLYPE